MILRYAHLSSNHLQEYTENASLKNTGSRTDYQKRPEFYTLRQQTTRGIFTTKENDVSH